MKNTEPKKIQHHYLESGLDDVYVSAFQFKDDSGKSYVRIPQIGQLHVLIADSIIQKRDKLSGNEVYFLRIEMNINKPTLSEILGIDADKITRWEKDDYDCPVDVEKQFRELAFENLVEGAIGEVDQWSRETSKQKGNGIMLTILHKNNSTTPTSPNDYKLCA